MTVDAFTMYEEKSFWTRDWGPYTPNPPLNESIQVGVAVVGGGLLGLEPEVTKLRWGKQKAAVVCHK